ncbi:ABC transporter ATP-binding protein [Mycobacterium yunnanensis]|uniref:ABC transporter ATP-binding protein n=1 Tax=Mycobacterium yunnanensis TaxID=368477 RepID=A0A9X3BW68_9MYCO|nr:ABC transporter ATP-binding protein [Mycobacterium yunnanensis]MCV7424055.1 ABC transporter ATP-binding protein [Mycobacterium yunnanensis]
MALFEVTDLAVTLHTGSRARGRQVVSAVRSFSFSVDRGQTLAIVGESGSGKSASLLAATRLLGVDAEVTGSVRFDDHDLLALSPKALRRILGKDIGFVFQDPQSNLHPFKTVGKQIEEVFRVHRAATRRELRARVEGLLDEVGIADPSHAYRAYPAQFSGGMRQRVMIAIAVALNPALIIADEPTTALDVSVQAGIIALLRRLQRDHGTAIVFVSHDLGVVAEIADDVVVVKDGLVVESGSREAIFAAPREEYTRELLAASRLHGVDAVAPAPPTATQAAAPLLSVRGLAKSYRTSIRGARRTAIEGLDFTIGTGEIVALVGESGSGKSTVGRIVAGLQYADSGDISLDGVTFPTALADGVPRLPAQTRRSVQMIFQDPYSSLHPRRTVRASLAAPLIAQRVARSDIPGRVDRAAADARVDPGLLDRYPAELSGGQRQRVAIARALVLSPALIVADEPLSSLDVTTQAEILALVADLTRRRSTAFLFITHDLGVVSSIAQRVIVLGPDGVEETGTTADVFGHPQSAYTRRLLDAVPRLDGARAS